MTTRILYAGLAVCEEELSFPAVVTIPPRTFPDRGLPAPAASRPSAADDARVAIGSVTPTDGSGVDIASANKLVSVGRGFRARTICIARRCN